MAAGAGDDDGQEAGGCMTDGWMRIRRGRFGGGGGRAVTARWGSGADIRGADEAAWGGGLREDQEDGRQGRGGRGGRG